MADALKAMYNKEFLCRFGEKVRSVYDSFDIEGFVAAAMDEPWAFQWLLRCRYIFGPSSCRSSNAAFILVQDFCLACSVAA